MSHLPCWDHVDYVPESMEIHSVVHYSPAGTILCDSNSTDIPVRDCVSGSSCLPQENSLCFYSLSLVGV